jgi:hypothetical protein
LLGFSVVTAPFLILAMTRAPSVCDILSSLNPLPADCHSPRAEIVAARSIWSLVLFLFLTKS